MRTLLMRMSNLHEERWLDHEYGVGCRYDSECVYSSLQMILVASHLYQ